MASTTTATLVHSDSTVEDDWQLWGGGTRGVLHGVGWQHQTDETDDELAIGWADSSILMPSSWAEDEQFTAEHLDTPIIYSLPSPSEAAWLDIGSFLERNDLQTDHEEATVPDVSNCMSAADGACELTNSDEQSAQATQLTTCDVDDVAGLIDEWLQASSSSHFDDACVDPRPITMHCSQLEALLLQTDGETAVDVEENDAVSCELDTDSERDDDSDWSYTGRKERRRSTGSRRRARVKPYRRPNAVPAVQRKKEQNKTAATRYRDKKRAEERDNEVECAELEKRNHELRMRVETMTHEVTVLRKLIVDIFRNPQPTD